MSKLRYGVAASLCLALALGSQLLARTPPRQAEAARLGEAARVDQAADTPSSGRQMGRGTVAVDGNLQGHFIVHPSVMGRRLTMMVDTGASLVALSHEDASRAGLKVSPADRKVTLNTANGTVTATMVRLGEVRLGDIVVRGVDAVVSPPGTLSVSLLGMSFLRRLNGYQVERGRLVLRG